MMKESNKKKLKEVLKGLNKASKTHAKQAKTIKNVIGNKKTKKQKVDSY